jgi:hypothetical protein
LSAIAMITAEEAAHLDMDVLIAKLYGKRSGHDPYRSGRGTESKMQREARARAALMRHTLFSGNTLDIVLCDRGDGIELLTMTVIDGDTASIEAYREPEAHADEEPNGEIARMMDDLTPDGAVWFEPNELTDCSHRGRISGCLITRTVRGEHTA